MIIKHNKINFNVFYFLLVVLCACFTCHAQQNTCQFNYTFKTEVVYNDTHGFEVSDTIERFAREQNKYLNKSRYFDSKFIRKPKEVRKYHTKQKHNTGDVGQLIDIYTEDGQWVPCTYFDRNSDTLLIVGEGFTNEREVMTPFVDMFDCDIVLFDFRGQGYKPFDIKNPETWPLDLAQVSFGMDSEICTLGQDEEKDVFAVIDYFKTKKNYKHVNGVSVCYASFIFLKAEALRPGLFDKIVVDGCWISVPLIVEKLKKDPKMIFSPQYGGWSKTWPCSQKWCGDLLEFLADAVWKLPFNNVSLLDYLPKIKNTPVLFFYGKDDLMVTRNEFEQLWEALGTREKVAIITSNPHVRNHLKQKEFYKLACDLFFDLSPAQCVEHLKSIHNVVDYHTEKLLKYKGNKNPSRRSPSQAQDSLLRANGR